VLLNIAALLSQLVESGKVHVLTIEPYVEKRTLRQNNTLHMWFAEIAEETGHSPDEIKTILKKKFYPKKTVAVVDELLTVPVSTTELTCAQMMDVMTQVQVFASEFGIPITDPIPEEMRELARRAEEEALYEEEAAQRQTA